MAVAAKNQINCIELRYDYFIVIATDAMWLISHKFSLNTKKVRIKYEENPIEPRLSLVARLKATICCIDCCETRPTNRQADSPRRLKCAQWTWTLQSRTASWPSLSFACFLMFDVIKHEGSSYPPDLAPYNQSYEKKVAIFNRRA